MKHILLIFSLLIMFNTSQTREILEFLKGQKSYHLSLLSEWNESTSEKDVERIEDLFLRLQKEIGGLQNVHFRTLHGSRFKHQVVLSFANEAVVQEYATHALHDSLRILAQEKVKSFETFSYWE